MRKSKPSPFSDKKRRITAGLGSLLPKTPENILTPNSKSADLLKNAERAPHPA